MASKSVTYCLTIHSSDVIWNSIFGCLLRLHFEVSCEAGPSDVMWGKIFRCQVRLNFQTSCDPPPYLHSHTTPKTENAENGWISFRSGECSLLMVCLFVAELVWFHETLLETILCNCLLQDVVSSKWGRRLRITQMNRKTFRKKRPSTSHNPWIILTWMFPYVSVLSVLLFSITCFFLGDLNGKSECKVLLFISPARPMGFMFVVWRSIFRTNFVSRKHSTKATGLTRGGGTSVTDQCFCIWEPRNTAWICLLPIAASIWFLFLQNYSNLTLRWSKISLIFCALGCAVVLCV